MPSKLFAGLGLVACLLAPTATAAPNVRLTNESHHSIRPRVAFAPNLNVVVVWQDDRDGNYEILWQKFDRSGIALTPVVHVTNTAATSARPDVSCDAAGNSHVVWQEGDNVNAAGTVYYCKLDPNGAKLVNDTVVYSSLAGDARVAALPNGEANLVYQRRMPADQDVYVRHATIAGVLNCEKHLSGTPNSYSKNPCIANAPDGSAHVTWPDLDFFFSWYLGRSTVTTSCTGGVSASYVGTPTTPAIDIAGSNEMSTFVLGTNIYGFASGGGTCRLTVGSGTCTQPSVAAEPTEGFLTWRDTRDGNNEIYYARLSGCSNTTGDVRLTSDPGSSVNPAIATPKDGSGSWAIVWSDDRDGNSEIYMTSRVLLEPPTPNPPTGLSAALSATACPPAAVLQWTDASDNETGFEIQVDTNASGTWSPALTLPPNSTTWTSGPLAYGSTYAFRVRAVNGTFASAWAGPASVSVGEEHRAISGTVSASWVDRVTESAPTVRPLPRATVRVVRSTGETVAETVSDYDTGHYAFADVAVHCGDQIVVALENPDLTSYAWAGAPCAYPGALTRATLLPSSSTVDLVWPPTGAGATSGDPVNGHALLERIAHDYWFGHLHVAAAERPALRLMTGNPGISGFYLTCDTFRLIRFGSRFSEFTTAVAHEFAHAMLHQHGGRMMNPGPTDDTYPQAAAMDEALADFFAAAAAGSATIYPKNWAGSAFSPVGALPDRTLTHVHHFPVCGGLYTPRGKYPDSEVLSGALWDWRERLANDRAQSRDGIDHAVWDVAFTIARLPVGDRTFLRVRNELALTAPGAAYPADLAWAFDRHNIRSAADNTCPVLPRITGLLSSLEPGGRRTRVQWEPIPGTTRYRVYARPVTSGGGAWLSAGVVVADSVVGTEYVHLEPDTAIVTAFVVASVDDSTGEDVATSAETPQVTGVGPVAPATPAHSRPVAFPNPTASGVTIEFGPSPTPPGPIVVSDVAGRTVRRLPALTRVAGGRWRAAWDGTRDDGRRLPPGAYLVRCGGTASARTVWVILLE